jgi:hypothetical protein
MGSPTFIPRRADAHASSGANPASTAASYQFHRFVLTIAAFRHEPPCGAPRCTRHIDARAPAGILPDGGVHRRIIVKSGSAPCVFSSLREHGAGQINAHFQRFNYNRRL